MQAALPLPNKSVRWAITQFLAATKRAGIRVRQIKLSPAEVVALHNDGYWPRVYFGTFEGVPLRLIRKNVWIS